MLKLLTDILRCELNKEAPEPKLIEQLTPEARTKLFLLAEKHDLTHIIAVFLKRNGLLTEDNISKAYQQTMKLVILRTENLISEQNRIYELFEQEKIYYLPLKGAIVRDYYSEPWYRTSCDVDILVKPEQLDQARKLLVSSLGYEEIKENYHDVMLHSPLGLHLELHFSILEEKENIDRLLSNVWEYATLDSEEGFRYSVSPEFFMFHILAHMVHHFYRGGCGIRPFLDLWLLRKQLVFDRDKLNELCGKCDILTFSEYIWKLVDVWFEDTAHDEVTQAMEGYILDGGLYGSKTNKVKLAKQESNGRFKYVFRRMFLSYKDLSTVYPDLEKCPALYPFYTVKRWCKLFNRHDLKGAMKELDLNNKLDASQISEVKDLFNRLGL